MENRLRRWADTGEYPDEPQPAPWNGLGQAGNPSQGRWTPHGPWLLMLIPVGIAMGILFAAACLLRLATLPLPRSARPHTGTNRP